jgi:outer membrane immunogenic protein
VGAGWEYGLTANWIIGLEYNYSAFETKSYQLNGTEVGNTYTFDAKPRDIQSVVGRISYKFGGPVVAKY